ncbi:MULTISPECIES: translation elongation factor Ts [unclassified Pseudodesulfovibrio]|uniref:translation elongation factor Ts n=1 Tax=unclassified Pseudodesulfovibrio TaxID=2661612 RepID=UPI000FEB6B31|nr:MULTISPECIES: translation elongation factor Ts [unclassified Pseudodesulfovibrio]MCJ2163134.1 translation elongation factor Ts [Pseudodesulfovibrio sp. S3-i]RWU07126.1 elongation factor Ts [Pseudodesulfovibrio sp. S3]
MSITAAQVKDLREKTGAGMMDCKKALVESGGDEEKAVMYLREKGLSKAAKKAGRDTSEGLVTPFVSEDGKTAVIAELLCETDFVAKGDDFQGFAAALSEKIAGLDVTSGTAEDLPADVADVTDLIAKLGENMGVGRFAKVTTDGVLGVYVHSNNKLATIVELTGTDDADTAKDVAMHVAAMNPTCITPDELSADVLEKEKALYIKQAMDEGKPQEIAEKIVVGRMNKFYKEVCLVEQAFIKDDKQTIKQILKGASVASFHRLALGEKAE